MKASLLVGLVVAASASLLLLAPHAEIAGLLDLTAERLPAPPEVRLLTPEDGDGVGAALAVAGEARSAAGKVIDVQMALDDGAWTSIPDIPRGQSLVAFQTQLALPPGDHVVAVRAWDGTAYSLTAHALVRRDSPTVRILSPADGDGVPAGPAEVSGVATGNAGVVRVSTGSAQVEAPVMPGGSWSARLDLPPGIHTLTATALGATASLPDITRVAAGTPTPPSLSIVTPADGAAYGEAGDLACGGGCILFGGTTSGADRILASIDGFAAGEATILPGGEWTFRLPVLRLASGPHRATFTPEGGVDQSVSFLARTPVALEIRGDTQPGLTLRSLSFQAVGEGADGARWRLDGEDVGSGPHIGITLRHGGLHTLEAQAQLPDGRAASASLTLYAYNRAPFVELAEPMLVGADIRFVADAADVDGAIASYRWEFGDGNVSSTTASTIIHRYGSRGVHVANLTVFDDFGANATATVVALVSNVPPLADFSWEPRAPTIQDVVVFNDTSVDPDGKLVARSWAIPGANATSAEAPSVRFATRGPQEVTLTVIDDSGALVTLTQRVNVSNLPPRALFRWEPVLPRAHEEVLFIDRSIDPDGSVASRAWSVGGSNATGNATLHTFRTPGLHNVTLEVVDDLGLRAELTLPLRVVDSEPVVSAVIVEPASPRALEDVRFRVLATDREGGIARLQWDFGNRATYDEREPLHRFARSGLHHGNVTVFDENGLFTVFPFHVQVVNAPPGGTLAVRSGGFAAFPTVLVANATDADGRIALYRFDADGDGEVDCETTRPTCLFTYAAPGPHLARVYVEDDEAAITEVQTLVQIEAPPAHLAPPTVRIEAPTPHAVLRGDHLIRGEATGVRPIAKVELQMRRDGFSYSGSAEAWRLATGGGSWTSLVDTRAFADGAYELVARVTDEAGGVGLARAPVTVLNGARASEVTLQLLDAPAEVDRDSSIRASAFHPQGVTSVRWRIDQGSWRYIAESPLAFRVDLDRDALTPGGHLLQLEAYRGPEEKATLDHRFRVPGTTPALVVDLPPGPIAHGLLRAQGRVVGDGYAQWRLDHDVWRDLPGARTWNLSHETGAIAGGEHTLSLRAVSPDGRLVSEPTLYRIQIVNPPFDTSEERPADAPRVVVPVPGAGVLWLLAALGLAAGWAARRRG